MPESLSIDKQKSEDADQFAISVVLRHLVPESVEEPAAGSENGSSIPNGLFRSNLTTDQTDVQLSKARESAESLTETIHAKYVVGCDGAHSWTRRQIGSIMEGEQTDFVWYSQPRLKN
jgi:phenol 2-monooxygenase